MILLLSTEQHIKPRFTFPKCEHLKSRKAIEQLFKTGKTVFVRPYKVFYQIVLANTSDLTTKQEPPQQGATNCQPPTEKLHTVPLQAGFAVSTRSFKHATDRNRVKRIGREAYRLNKQPLMDKLTEKNMQLQVFFVYTDKILPNFSEAETTMKTCLNKLMAIAEK